MKLLAASLVMGPLLLIGALPVGAGQLSVVPGSSVRVQIAAAGDSAADRDTYRRKAQEDLREWQRRLRDFGDKVEAKGKATGNAADSDLNQAWSNTEAASDRLQTVGAEGWESAKTSFEKASHDLAETWRKINPEDK